MAGEALLAPGPNIWAARGFPGSLHVQETRIWSTDRIPGHPSHSILVTNHYGGEEVTHMLQAETPAESQRWMEAFWQHFYDLSQWKHCSDKVMKVEMPPLRRPLMMLPRHGSLYHEMALEPAADDIEAVTEILARRVSGLSDPTWLSLLEGSSSELASCHDTSTSPCPPQPPWSRPRTLSLDAKLSRLKGRSGHLLAPPSPRVPHDPSHSSSGSSSSDSPILDSERPPRPPSRPRLNPHAWLQSQV